jgi:hypothetical protein
MKRIIRKLFFRDVTIREYSPVAIGEEISERVYLEMPGRILDVSQNHWLLSLEPVVLGVWMEKEEDILPFAGKPACKMYFSDRALEANGRRPAARNDRSAMDNYYEAKGVTGMRDIRRYVVAVAELEFFDRIVENDGTLFLFRCIASSIRHISFIRTCLLFFGFYKKPRLSFRQFKSLVASHSYPRRVRVISFREGEAFNIFPMDLLGTIPARKRWVFGLRHSNHSLPRIMATGKIVVSEASSENKGTIYQLGKHHQSGLVAMDSLPFRTTGSEIFAFPVPEWAESYQEIRIVKTMNLGSHMLLWGESVNEKMVKTLSAHLFHIPFMLWLHQRKRGREYPLA